MVDDGQASTISRRKLCLDSEYHGTANHRKREAPETVAAGRASGLTEAEQSRGGEQANDSTENGKEREGICVRARERVCVRGK